MIQLDDVQFGYSTSRHAAGISFAMCIPSLRIAAGERVACIGPSGSGKTTLVNLIAGITTPTRGVVRVDGAEVHRMPDAARREFRLRRIGMVFQEFELLEHLTALENIRLPLMLGAGADDDDAAIELATSLGIAHVVHRKPRRLSHGERQRVGVCRALVTRPRLILCDEPTGNLDPDATHATLDVLFAHAKDASATILMVTHNHDLLARFDRVIDMRELIRGPERGA